MRTTLLALSLFFIAIAAAPAVAQTAPDVAPHAQLAAHPAARLHGQWRGHGWTMQRDGSRAEFDVIERVRWNLAGTALIVEGFGFHIDPETGELGVGHDAFALIIWNDETDTPQFHARRAGESFQSYEMTWDAESERLIWEVQPGRVRFLISIKEGVWTETGQFSQDGGENWTPFLEMSLTKQE